MKAQYKLNNVDRVDASLTITMRISEWREFVAQLPQAYPSWKLSSIIRHMVEKAEQQYSSTDESEP